MLKPIEVTRPRATRNERGGRLDGTPDPSGVLRPRVMQKCERVLAEVPREPNAITELKGQIDSLVQKSLGVGDAIVRDRHLRECTERPCPPPAPADLACELGALLEECPSSLAVTRLEGDRAEQGERLRSPLIVRK